jgi:hypothetical protein
MAPLVGVGPFGSMRSVPVVRGVECLFVRAERHAVRLLQGVGHFVDLAVGVDAVDRAVLELASFRAQIARIGKIDAALLIQRHVVGRVEAMAVKTIGDHGALLGLGVPAADAAAAFIGTLAGKELALGAKVQAVRLVTVVGEDFGLLSLGIETQDHAVIGAKRDVREVNAAVGRNRRALGEPALDGGRAGEEFFQRSARGHDRARFGFVSGRRRTRRHRQETEGQKRQTARTHGVSPQMSWIG